MKTYRDDDRDGIFKRIRELEVKLRDDNRGMRLTVVDHEVGIPSNISIYFDPGIVKISN